MSARDESVVSPDRFHAYMASRRGVSPLSLSVPPRLVITFNRSMFDAVRRRARCRTLDWYYSGRLAVGSLRGTDLAVLHSAMGSAASAMMLEEMIASGAREVVEAGICGGLAPPAKAGDVILATEAFSDEGTSQHYFGGTRRFPASPSLARALRQTAVADGLGFREGGVWTTDAPYRETRRKVSGFRRKGALGVNMETSALFAVARYRGIKAASIQVVSDLVEERAWKPAFHEKVVDENSVRAALLAAEALLPRRL